MTTPDIPALIANLRERAPGTHLAYDGMLMGQAAAALESQQAQLAAAEATIAAAPHANSCASDYDQGDDDQRPCNCWKAAYPSHAVLDGVRALAWDEGFVDGNNHIEGTVPDWNPYGTNVQTGDPS